MRRRPCGGGIGKTSGDRYANQFAIDPWDCTGILVVFCLVFLAATYASHKRKDSR